MPEIKKWDENLELFSKFKWREIETGINMAMFIKNRKLKVGETAVVGVMIRNINVVPVASKVHIGADTHNIKDCYCANVDKIEAGEVYCNLFNVPLNKRANKKPGQHSMGAFVELKNAKQKAGAIARGVMGALIGIRPGHSIKGMSTPFEVIP